MHWSLGAECCTTDTSTAPVRSLLFDLVWRVLVASGVSLWLRNVVLGGVVDVWGGRRGERLLFFSPFTS